MPIASASAFSSSAMRAMRTQFALIVSEPLLPVLFRRHDDCPGPAARNPDVRFDQNGQAERMGIPNRGA